MNSLEKYRQNQEDKAFHQQKANQKTTVKCVPMLMNTDMVIASENLNKTETRRIVFGEKSKFNKYKNIQFIGELLNGNFLFEGNLYGTASKEKFEVSPKAKKGTILWIRETWQVTHWEHPTSENYGYIHKSTENGLEWQNNTENWTWKSSIFMPKQACKLFLEVTNVKLERLQDITAEDALKEGVKQYNKNTFEDYEDANMFVDSAKKSFKTLWQSINGPKSWDNNPFVFVYQFKKVDKPLNFI
jgi:hypothetical protein